MPWSAVYAQTHFPVRMRINRGCKRSKMREIQHFLVFFAPDCHKIVTYVSHVTVTGSNHLYSLRDMETPGFLCAYAYFCPNLLGNS